MTLASVGLQVTTATNGEAMRATDTQDESVEAPINGARRTSIESPVTTESDGSIPEAHTPRPHPPIEEPEEQPGEHTPETEPDSDPDPGSDQQRRRPPRPGKDRH